LCPQWRMYRCNEVLGEHLVNVAVECSFNFFSRPLFLPYR
jgi:hypothetical protein